MTRPFFAVLLVLAFLRPAAAAPAARPSNAGPTLFHWWTSPSELAALDALIALFEKQYPDMKVTASLTDAHGGGGRLFSVIRTAATTANPPDAFQLHAGAPLRPYFDAGLVSAIDKLWIDEGLDRTVPPIVQSMSQIDGHYYAIPMNVHRNNLIWYNKALLDRHKIDPATLVTWEAFFEAAEKLKAAGVPSPCQLGVAWSVGVAFESILASLGIEGYEDWINGKITAADDARLVQAFTILRTYLQLANPDHARTDWPVAIQRVARGESAFCMMGDWANGEFRLAKQTYGKDYGVIPVPGAKGLYGATIDGFARPPRAAASSASDRWMRLAASRDGQDAFNAVKGSISDRRPQVGEGHLSQPAERNARRLQGRPRQRDGEVRRGSRREEGGRRHRRPRRAIAEQVHARVVPDGGDEGALEAHAHPQLDAPPRLGGERLAVERRRQHS
jgi:glucose/mannose transport system substrate-binding protein